MPDRQPHMEDIMHKKTKAPPPQKKKSDTQKATKATKEPVQGRGEREAAIPLW